MRVTNNILINNMKSNIRTNIRNLEKYQKQLATGQRINKPSDDPVGLVTVMRLSSRLRDNEQFKENVDDAISWLIATDSALGSLTSSLNRVYELAVNGATGTLTYEDRHALSAEVKRIRAQVVDIINATHGDRYIFGGTNTKQEPYDGAVWHDNEETIYYEIGMSIKMDVNLTAQEVFKTNDMLGMLDNVILHLETDAPALNTDLADIKNNIDRVLACRAEVGARMNHLELTGQRLLEQFENFMTVLSEKGDIDPVQVIMDLKNQENVYSSALAVGARIIMPTLMDFLR